MRKKREEFQKIASVEPGSIAWEMEIEPGDTLISINGEKVEDIFDYQYLTNEEFLTVVIRKANGEEWELEIEKEYEDDLGMEFEHPLLDAYRSCSNKCIFCFIDQMPKGMRDTLYFKDDDSRLSFLQGNYVTLTNMSDHDIDKIIRYHLGPINVSFQTLNPTLRCEMLHNRFAGEALKKVDRLSEAGIELNGQIVLCKGVNDGEELEFSLKTLEKYVPQLQSVSVVPVGLSKYRDGLYPLEPFTKEDAGKVIDQIERWQEYYLNKYGTHLVHAGDEWYLKAERPLPEEERYDGYIQLENGVGMLRLLISEVHQELEELTAGATDGSGGQVSSVHNITRKVTLATGLAACSVIEELSRDIMAAVPGLTCEVAAIRNDFFGEMITVSGLITGQDLMAQLKGHELGDALLIPCNMLRSGENVFLDDVTVEDVANALQTPVVIVKSSGQSLVRACVGM